MWFEEVALIRGDNDCYDSFIYKECRCNFLSSVRVTRSDARSSRNMKCKNFSPSPKPRSGSTFHRRLSDNSCFAGPWCTCAKTGATGCPNPLSGRCSRTGGGDVFARDGRRV